MKVSITLIIIAMTIIIIIIIIIEFISNKNYWWTSLEFLVATSFIRAPRLSLIILGVFSNAVVCIVSIFVRIQNDHYYHHYYNYFNSFKTFEFPDWIPSFSVPKKCFWGSLS